MTDSNSKEVSKQPSHIAFTVEEGKNDHNHWRNIGAAWPAKDGGLSLKLNALPVDGRVTLRPREELEKLRDERNEKANQPEKSQEISQKIDSP